MEQMLHYGAHNTMNAEVFSSSSQRRTGYRARRKYRIVGKGECKESTLVEVGVSSFYSYSLAIYIIVHC